MNLFQAIYCNQYEELVRTGRDGGKARKNGIIIITVAIVINIFTIATILVLIGRAGFMSPTVHRIAYAAGSGKAAGKLIAALMIMIIGAIVWVTLGKESYFEKTIYTFNGLPPGRAKTGSTAGSCLLFRVHSCLSSTGSNTYVCASLINTQCFFLRRCDMRIVSKVLLYLMVLLFAGAGVNHFINPGFYLKIMPPYVPFHKTMVAITGVLEIVFGLLLLPQSTRSLAAWSIIILLIAIFPANLQMAIDWQRKAHPHLWIAYARLPLQLVLIRWAYQFTKEQLQYES